MGLLPRSFLYTSKDVRVQFVLASYLAYAFFVYQLFVKTRRKEQLIVHLGYFKRSDVVANRLVLILDTLRVIRDQPADPRLRSLEALEMDVRALRMALDPHGEHVAETLCDSVRGLRTDLQALTAATREAHGLDTGSMTDSQAPATPVLLEILAEIRKLKKGDLKIQKRPPPFSLFNFFRRAPAEDLARERIQANPSPFHELD